MSDCFFPPTAAQDAYHCLAGRIEVQCALTACDRGNYFKTTKQKQIQLIYIKTAVPDRESTKMSQTTAGTIISCTAATLQSATINTDLVVLKWKIEE